MIIHCKTRLVVCITMILGLISSTIVMASTTDLSTYIENNYFLTATDESHSASDVISLIKSNYIPLSASIGSVQRSTVTVTVDSNGDILQVSALGANEAVNNAAKQAVLKAGNLPIDSSNPLYPTFSIVFSGTTN